MKNTIYDGLFNISMSNKLKLGFGATFILTFILGIISLFSLIELSSMTEKMYKHPFTVSNAVRDINSNIISMHRSMKDVTLSTNKKELDDAILKVDALEQKVIKSFNIVFDRFLGDLSDVRNKYELFIAWKPIRDKVILLVKDNKRAEAAEITKKEGAVYVQGLTNEMNGLILFANKKAETFFVSTQVEKRNAITTLIILLLLILFLSIMIARKIIFNINSAINVLTLGLNKFFSFLSTQSKEISKIEYFKNDEFGKMINVINSNIEVSAKLHRDLNNLFSVVDKNVILSKTNAKGVITYISEAFIEISGYTKEELIGKPHNIVRHPDSQKETFKDLWATIKAGNIWTGEIKNLKKNGGFYWVAVVITPEFDDNKNIIGYSALRQDITNKKAIEELSNSFEQQVKDRTEELHLMNKQITDSIEYASLIQQSLIPEKEVLKNSFSDFFAIWKPRDKVGGDIYLFEKINEDESYLMIIDCTGHGVHGAFITMLVKALERQVIFNIQMNEHSINPSAILSFFNRSIKQLLKQENDNSLSNAGFDGAVLYYNKQEQLIKFAGANSSLFYIDEKADFKIIKGNRYSVGYKNCDLDYEYTDYEISVKNGMQFYLSTDGYFDQIGGNKSFPFGKNRFRKLISNNHTKTMDEQKEVLINSLIEYQDKEEFTDDITVLGFKVEEKNIYELIFEYDGSLTQGIISHYVDVLEHKIENMALLGKISTLVIELTQNMMNYSKTEDLDCREILPEGFLELKKDKENRYFVKSKNIISVEDKEKIEPTLLELTKLSRAEIKKRYRELRKSGEKSHSLGAGIGFYEIAKLLDSIEYTFIQINKEKYIFEFKGSIS